MWGGLPRPLLVQELKQKHKLSVRFGPWKEQAGKRLTAAAIRGELPIYVFRDRGRQPKGRSALSAELIVRVPAAVVGRLIASRGALPDHPIRPSLKAAGNNMELFVLLEGGLLVVQIKEFEKWYRAERKRGKWPSQKSRVRAGPGRPTKQTYRLRNAVVALVSNQLWNLKDGLNKLRRLLVANDYSEVPTPATLGSLVDQIFRETGDIQFRRIKRPRRKDELISKNNLVPNSKSSVIDTAIVR
jgi:hypothetical protein